MSQSEFYPGPQMCWASPGIRPRTMSSAGIRVYFLWGPASPCLAGALHIQIELLRALVVVTEVGATPLGEPVRFGQALVVILASNIRGLTLSGTRGCGEGSGSHIAKGSQRSSSQL
jgi:hypothetical protein